MSLNRRVDRLEKDLTDLGGATCTVCHDGEAAIYGRVVIRWFGPESTRDEIVPDDRYDEHGHCRKCGELRPVGTILARLAEVAA
jgi:hypothetical protein